MVKSPEQSLILRCKSGDTNAFGPLIKLYRKQLYSYLYRLFNDKTLAEETLQETLIKTWKGIDKYSDRQKFSSWLFTVAHNCSMDELRRQKHNKLFTNEEPDELAGDDNPIRKLEREELREMINDAVETLSFNQKNVFLLRVEGGFTFKEISDISCQPLNTVLSHMNYSIKKIKKRLSSNYD
jgi:RNA polymerase sigma factor (sigma-70 family)